MKYHNREISEEQFERIIEAYEDCFLHLVRWVKPAYSIENEIRDMRKKIRNIIENSENKTE